MPGFKTPRDTRCLDELGLDCKQIFALVAIVAHWKVTGSGVSRKEIFRVVAAYLQYDLGSACTDLERRRYIATSGKIGNELLYCPTRLGVQKVLEAGTTLPGSRAA
jgi:hypothetical protein